MTWRAGGYVAEQRIGAGVSADVWRGRSLRGGAQVALKRIAVRSAQDRRIATREAALLARLTHPNLVRLHDLVPTAHHVVLVLDLAGGPSLATVLARRGRLSPGEAVSVIAPIGAALAYLHAGGVAHGDVSAANVLFTDRGMPLLADLGMARVVGSAGHPGIGATPGYLDPAVAGGGPPTRASDVFALAAVAVHALTGQLVWPADPARVGQRIAELLGAVPHRMAEALRPALVVDPARRAAAAAFALEFGDSHPAAPVELTEQDPELRLEPRLLTRPLGPGPVPARPRAARVARAARPVGLPRLPEAALAAGLGAGLIGGGAIALTTGPSEPSATAATATITAAPAVAPPGPSPVAGPDRAAEARQLLAALDRIRGQAYATRDPSLLARVYRSGDLLDHEVDVLLKSVPDGCRLLNVRTSYDDVSVDVQADLWTIAARAVPTPPRLDCPDRAEEQLPAPPPGRLRIEVERSGASARVSGVTELDAVPTPGPGRGPAD